MPSYGGGAMTKSYAGQKAAAAARNQRINSGVEYEERHYAGAPEDDEDPEGGAAGEFLIEEEEALVYAPGQSRHDLEAEAAVYEDENGFLQNKLSKIDPAHRDQPSASVDFYGNALNNNEQLVTNDAELNYWYSHFRYVHFVGALILIAVIAVIGGMAGAGELDGKGTTTTYFLRANTLPPPSLINQIVVENHPHLFWMVFALVPLALYHLLLGFPSHLFTCFGRGQKNGYDEYENLENIYYTNWFHEMAIHGVTGNKHYVHAASYSVLVLFIGIVVGVTDIFLQISLFMFSFASTMGLIYMDYGNARLVQENEFNKNRVSAAYPVDQQKHTSSLIEDWVQDFITDPFTKWIPYIISIFCESIVFITIWAYFGVAIDEHGSHPYWFAYVAVIMYTIFKLYHYLLVWLLWVDMTFIGLTYPQNERLHAILNLVAVIVITCCIVFGAMDKDVLYSN